MFANGRRQEWELKSSQGATTSKENVRVRWVEVGVAGKSSICSGVSDVTGKWEVTVTNNGSEAARGRGMFESFIKSAGMARYDTVFSTYLGSNPHAKGLTVCSLFQRKR